MTNDIRHLVSIKTISRVDPIEGADAIELATVGGWKAVVKKGEFTEGQPILYFEIDSFLPKKVEPFAFLSERAKKTPVSPYTYKKVEGHALKTIKLRGEISQGLILPLNLFPPLNEESTQDQVTGYFQALGVFKYDPYFTKPQPRTKNGHGLTPFPSHLVRKTDSERVQNLSDAFLSGMDKADWFATEKLDGTSATFIKTEDGEFICASRNYIVPLEDSIQGDIAVKYDLENIMPNGSYIQGEIVGPGIQGNPLDLDDNRLFVFEFSADTEDHDADFMLFASGNQVPRLYDFEFPDTIEQALDQVYDMKSTINPKVQSEGVVWWNKNREVFRETGMRPNFKAINNKFLLKQK